MTERKKPEPLTQEQLNEIEKNNGLLKEFSRFVADFHAKNPNAENLTSILYNFFILGAVTVQQRTQAVTMDTAKEINEMKMVMFTYMEAMKSQANGEQP